MRKTTLFVCAAALCLAIGFQRAEANPFAAELNATDHGTTASLNFRLNEAATTVTVEIVNSSLAVVRTIDAGALAQGPHSVVWDKTNDLSAPVPSDIYTFRVTAASVGYGVWTIISNDANPANQFFSPRGVAVNKDQTSPYFGRLYVTENPGAVTGGRTTVGDGLFVLSNDNADITGQGNNAYSGGAGFPTSSSGPYDVAWCADGRLFITDWTDTNSAIWVAEEANLSANFKRLFANSASRDSSGRVLVPTGTAYLHGSLENVTVVGSGAGTRLYTLDEDVGAGQLLQYDIGTVSENYGTTPTIVAPNNGIFPGQNHNAVPDGSGGFWYYQNRSADGVGGLYILTHWNGSSYDYTSAIDSPGLLSGATGGHCDISDDGNTIVGTRSAGFYVIDVTDAPTTVTASIVPHTGTTVRDIVFDPAGNVAVVSNSSERLRVYSPPGASAYVTSSPTGVLIAVGPAAIKDWELY